MPLRMRTQSAGRPATESLGGGTGERVGRGGRGKRPREGNDERVDELNGQGNDQGLGANEGVEGVNGNVERANRGAPDFSTTIAMKDFTYDMVCVVGAYHIRVEMHRIDQAIKDHGFHIECQISSGESSQSSSKLVTVLLQEIMTILHPVLHHSPGLALAASCP
ncbi:hypothetical protein Tco_0876179 [Tanacetum coccineum]|uniref:Uncharacterized protein n=1 Tax=Tanacetum coccineum TaxID=301880 RepID=A0ABQ5BUM1_9ASTR